MGYGKALKALDDALPSIINGLKDEDLLMITADHGNDPTYKGTDHTRENVPVLVYYKGIIPKPLKAFETFADIGCTIADNFEVALPPIGESQLKQICSIEK